MNDSLNQTPLIPGINLDEIRLPQNFGETFGVKKITARIPVGKVNKASFFRINPHEDMHLQTMVLELKQENETYLALQAVWHVIPDMLRAVMLFPGIDLKGNPFLLPIPLPGDDGHWNPWHQTLHTAAQLAMKRWVRISANRSAGGYDIFEALGKLPEPEWPELELQEIINIAFQDKVIADADHPVIRQLLGLL